MSTRSTRLYELCTYARTPYLLNLIDGGYAEATPEDMADLWTNWCQGSEDAGVTPDLPGFTEWLTGTGAFDGCDPAEIQW